MRKSLLVRKLIIPALVAAGLPAVVAPAFAWNSPNHQYHLDVVNKTGQDVNDDSIYVICRSGFGPWVAPQGAAPAYTPTPGWNTVPPWPFAWGNVVGNALAFKFAGQLIPPNGIVTKNIYITVPGLTGPWQSVVWERWTFNGVSVGDTVHVGFCIDSPPRLANPDVTPAGTPNTLNMVVRNLQFAQSPSYIPNNLLTPSYPPALALFAASLDPVRAGPIVATPGTCQDISPPVDPSILEPLPGGRTVLAKGTVEDAHGNQYQFMCEFAAPPSSSSVPGIAPLGLILLAILLASVGGVLVWRKGRGRPESQAA